MGLLGLTWTHLDSLDSLGLNWSHLVSHGLTWSHLVSLGLTWSHMVSPGLTLVSLRSPWVSPWYSHVYVLPGYTGFKRVQILPLLYTRVLRYTSLKPMHCHYSSITQTLKPMRTATQKQLEGSKNVQKLLKPMCIAATIAHQPATRRRSTTP